MNVYFVRFAVVEAQLVPNDTNLINTVVFPSDMMKSSTFSSAQITIPKDALIHQRETEGENKYFKLNLIQEVRNSLNFRCSSASSKLCCKQFTVLY